MQHYDNYETYCLVSLRPVTWKRRLSKLEQLVAKEKAVKIVQAAEKAIEQIGFPGYFSTKDYKKWEEATLNHPAVLFADDFSKPPKYFDGNFSCNSLGHYVQRYCIPSTMKSEEVFSDALLRICEIEWQKGNKELFMYHQKIDPLSECNLQSIWLYVYPEDGRRGILFFKSMIRDMIPLDLMRVELCIPEKLSEDFFKHYDQNLEENIKR